MINLFFVILYIINVIMNNDNNKLDLSIGIYIFLIIIVFLIGIKL